MIYLLTAYGVVLTTIWVVASRLDETLSSEAKTNIAERLRGTNWIQAWPELFIRLFDSIFGEKHLTWKCFRRSCYASLLAVSAAMLLAFSVRPPNIDRFLYNVGQGDWSVAIFGILVIVNFLFDYLSLLETRWLLRYALSASVGRQILILALDAVLTAGVIIAAFTFYGLGRFIFPGSLSLDTSMFGSISSFAAVHLDYAITLMSFRIPEGSFQLGVLAYSTYFTSASLWLFLLTSVAIRVVWTTMRALQQEKPPFDLEDKPVRTLGIVACIAVVLTFPVFLAFSTVF